MITKEEIGKKIDTAIERRNKCDALSVAWYFYEGQISAFTTIYVSMD